MSIFLDEGGTIELEGGVFDIPADNTRVHGTLWQNGAMIEVCYYPPEIELDTHPSDRMELKITDKNLRQTSCHLNVEDALEIISGLTKGIIKCLEDKVPYNPA